ncbi:BED-type domain-containing protein [Heracleum sosnowskyi]|uniref:BED-type domain-containing protein n=1 Tax=Heracleum sosnowskyi TaxID=360622 RepID=A0AAD8JBR8_9APIA|nr:BED-type domain-containing protein [Heracleum sosnowskyi]
MDGADMDGPNKEPNNQQSEQQNQDQEGTLKKNKNSKVSSSKRQKPSKDAKGGEDSSRKRKNSSPWWDHYDKTDDPDFAKCKYCFTLIGSNPINGTSPLANHTKRCKMLPANLDKKQKILNFESQTIVNKDGTTETINVSKPWIFSQEASRSALAKMLIMDELPFMFVEREGMENLTVEQPVILIDETVDDI